MPAFLYGLLSWMAAGLVQRVLVGAGITLVVFTGTESMVESALNSIGAKFGALPSTVAQIAMLAGVGEFLTLLGAALLTRLAIDAAMNIAGFKVNGN